MNRPVLLVAAALAAACAVPAAANAADVVHQGGALVYRADPGGANLLISVSEDWETQVKYLTFSDATQTSAPGCEVTTGYSPHVRCLLDPGRPVVAEGSEARDSLSVYFSGVPDAMPIELRGNGGNDALEDASSGAAGRTLLGGPGDDKLQGHGGADTLDGGPGTDDLDGGDGADAVRGGDGDDLLSGDRYKTPAADLLDGGAGTDTIDGEWTIPEKLDNQPPATISMDGQANDGRPGEGDNVIAVERIKGYISTSFTGSDAAETVEILNPADRGAQDLKGLGGADRLVGHASADTVDGGAGDDHLEGGWNNDTIAGGAGRDMIFGDKATSESCWYSCSVPFGNDTIDARDGEADQIDCGVGTDVARVDAVDTVANCETVEGAGTTAAPAPAAPGAAPAPGARPALALLGTRSLRGLRRGRLAVGVPCPAACKVSVQLKAGRRVLATGRRTLLAAGTAKVTLKVAAKQRRAVARMKRAKATLVVRVTAAEGSSSLRRAVTLRR